MALTIMRSCRARAFTEIVLRPRLVAPAGVDAVRLRRALEKAEHACLVSASLSTPIRLEPEPAG